MSKKKGIERRVNPVLNLVLYYDTSYILCNATINMHKL